ncbi:ATP-dependent nuclease [Cupriavidus oxalaticus]|uniref:ATP-dependent nuclease n=1 Tax=Cupriavidus oxalaticus TaxID=96344 RepID=UPI003F73BBEE
MSFRAEAGQSYWAGVVGASVLNPRAVFAVSWTQRPSERRRIAVPFSNYKQGAAVTVISKLVLQNFKKFKVLELDFNDATNILVGDNEAGKSTVLLALDLTLSASRGRVESVGVEALLCKEAVEAFLAGDRKPENLPVLCVEAWLMAGENFELNGKNNSKGIEADGVRLEIAPIEEYGRAIAELLAQEEPNFPYEYYGVRFNTFSGEPVVAQRRPVRHLSLDSSRIDSEHAVREYTRAVFSVHTDVPTRHRLENQYRRGKDAFRKEYLGPVNQELVDYQFGVRSGHRSNLEVDLQIMEDGIPLESRGKGRQCFLKTEFALRRHKNNGASLHALLLEEPENHLSHTSMRRLVRSLEGAAQTQLFVATHSSHIASRLDLRHAQLLGTNNQASSLKALSEETANFFIKAPDNNVLEFALSQRVILVEGDAEFILFDALYRAASGGTSPEQDGVHVMAIGGTSFKRYLELGRLLGIRTAAIRDNDGNFQSNCVDSFAEHAYEAGKVFADADNTKYTFEVSLYDCNTAICDALFAVGRRTLTPLEYMLANKTDAALSLLTSQHVLSVPRYIEEAVQWIRG